MTTPDLVSIAPVRSALYTWRSARGPMTTVICKATYRLAPTESPLAEEQEYPNEDDDHWNDDAGRSLHAPSDFVPMKPRAEVIVVGSAFSGGAPKKKIVARVIVGEVDKALQVVGDRHYSGEGVLTEPSAFVKMPLRYERASGGPGTTNPVGMSWDHVDNRGRTKLPNILPVEYEPGPERGPIDSVGFGPIGRAWPLRAARLDAAGERWLRPSHQDEPMPEAFDSGFFLSAPHDQQLDELRANERVVLEHLHRDRVRLVTSLPGIEPRVFVDRGAGAPHELAMRGDTLWIDTERAICTLVWRGQVPLFPDAPRSIVVASAMIGQRLAWSEVEPLLSRPLLGTASAMRLERGPRPSVPPPPSRSPRVDTLDDTAEVEARRSPETVENTDVIPGGQVARALPFTHAEAQQQRRSPPLNSTIETVLEDEDLIPSSQADGTARSRTRGSSPVWLPEARPPVSPPRPSPSGLGSVAPSPPREVVRTPSPPPPPPPPPVFGAPPSADSNPWAASPMPSSVASPSLVKEATSGWSRPSVLPAPPPPPPLVEGPSSLRADAIAPSALAASNAAAHEAPRARPAPSVAPARPEIETRASTFVDLIWFDESLAARVRASDTFKSLFSTQGATWRKAGDEPKVKDAPEVRDRRDVMRAMTGAAAIEAERARDALEASFTDPVSFSYPLVLVAGELAVSFDEQALLKVSLQVGATLAGTDKRLRDALAVANEGTRAEPPPTPEGHAALLRHLQEAFGGGRGSQTALEVSAMRVALDERLYKKKKLLGAKRLRAELLTTNGGVSLPVYLPESLDSSLPLMPKVKVRIIGELRHQEDHTEAHPLALVALAIGRVIKGG